LGQQACHPLSQPRSEGHAARRLKKLWRLGRQKAVSADVIEMLFAVWTVAAVTSGAGLKKCQM